MLKVISILCILSSISFSCEKDISHPLDDFDFQDFVEFTKLCVIANRKESRYQEELENSGWEIQKLYIPYERREKEILEGENILLTMPRYSYGIKAKNGPLTVIIFKDIVENSIDLAALTSSSPTFPTLPEDVINRDILNYYNRLKVKDNFTSFEEDEFLTLGGYRFGGAVSCIAVLELLTMQQSTPKNYPPHFCNFFTLGSPPIIGKKLRQVLNTAIGDSWRIYFNDDSIAQYIRSYDDNKLIFYDGSHQQGMLFHPGENIEFKGNNFSNPTLEDYILEIQHFLRKKVDTWKPQEAKDIYYHYYGGTYFHESSRVLLSNFRSYNLPEEIKKQSIKNLTSTSWYGTRSGYFYSYPHHPKRCNDMLFYQLWRTTEISAFYQTEDVYGLLKYLDKNLSLFANKEITSPYFHRIIKFLDIKREQLETFIKMDESKLDSSLNNILEFITLEDFGEQHFKRRAIDFISHYLQQKN